MPGFDQTGPLGAGPMTGGGLGRCNPGAQGAEPVGYGVGRGGRPRGGGRGRCFGGGRGFGMARLQRGRQWTPAATPNGGDDAMRAEVRALTNEVARLRAELRAYTGGTAQAES